MARGWRLAWLALLGCAAGCSSSSSGGAPASPLSRWFTDDDCPARALVEVARVPTAPWSERASIHGTALLEDEEMRASVPVSGGAPVEEGIPAIGGVALQAASGTWVLQNPWNDSSRVALMTTGSGGSVIACSPAGSGGQSPVGVAADSTGTYVAYTDCPLTAETCDLVLAKLGD
jgi:hypothetical protein